MNAVHGEPKRWSLVVRRSSILIGLLSLAALTLLACNRTPRTDPAMVDLAVRATVYAMPTPTPRLVEVTRIVEVTVEVPVEVTRVVEVTRLMEATPTPTPSATVTPTATPAPSIEAAALQVGEPTPSPQEPSTTLKQAAYICPATSERSYALVPVDGGGAEHPDALHADLNLSLRGYEPVDAPLTLIDVDGPADSDAPQLAGIFEDGRLPAFVAAYQVHGWDWSCGEHGCPVAPPDPNAVTLLGLGVHPGEPLSIPSRRAPIYAGGFKALVLYADEDSVTLGYTRADSVANGYSVHIENLCVDPALVALYRAANASGRLGLPGLYNGEILGVARGSEVDVATRDRGAFLDPRTRKNWWRGW